MVVIV